MKAGGMHQVEAPQFADLNGAEEVLMRDIEELENYMSQNEKE